MSCEEEDCACQHRPKGNHGNVHKVIVNDDGSYTLRCETAIDNDNDIRMCYFCKLWMMGTCIEIPTYGHVCIRCSDTVDMLALFDDVYPTNCDRFRVFPSLAEDIPNIKPQMCDECHKTHPIVKDLVSFEDEYTLVYVLNETPEGKNADVYFSALYCKISENTQNREDALKAKAERYQASRKRVFTTFIPITKDLPDEKLSQFISKKCARFANDTARAELDALCDKPILNNEETLRILTFMLYKPSCEMPDNVRL